MMRSALFSVLLLSSSCPATPPPPASRFDAAEQAVSARNFVRARELYHEAMANEPDVERRAKARARAGNIEWRMLHDLNAARVTLADATDEQGLIERARAELELAHDAPAAHAFALKAIAAATKHSDLRRARIADAYILIRPVRDARLDRRCADAEQLRPVVASMRTLIENDGPYISAAAALLNAAILTNDRDAMLAGWRAYYGKDPADVPADPQGLGLALARDKFFDEAALVLADPCAAKPVEDSNARDVVAYAAALRRIREVTEEHYRHVPLGDADADAFHAALQREARTLWQRLGGEGEFDSDAFQKMVFAGFGTIVAMGKTAGVDDLHLGHAVLDTTKDVEQYGHKATIRFVALDGMVSNGFSTWANDGAGGDGGWNNSQGIFQVRPMYADDPIGEWRDTTDAAAIAERDEEIRKETLRDETRDSSSAPRAAKLRMRMQANAAVLHELEARHLSGDSLRSAFMERVDHDVFASSIFAHEGRHAIDKQIGKFSSEDLEFRAKLSEVVFAPSPRRAITSGILVDLGPSTPHGKANRRIFDGVTKWMLANRSAIAGFDPAKRPLTQIDRLTDDQLRTAFRAMDPLAASSTR
jgi:hypothetical protein